ncbi:uncharacterized protein MELLADRAFT_78154 [Melampsora larici-populina 98AG31]|uniref:Uncharacterized protein n=1 Tax=Melampsora larici-populina (strain 98AG31 / pathotype 3-4-7) TaxID=747676 RepID=F4RQY1_MELLP|nr:uncharacterized protein MELLADRAFT_78154 [Melampsora larici-populina 98AG31]EGG05242.1 hypothetical protein MELLADRAFT_78154 [Melampsora larici-populina 98AG31]
MSPMKPPHRHRLLKTDEGQEPPKQSSSRSVFVRCPRPPCVASYLPFNAAHHSRSCKHFRCLNTHCGFTGTEAQAQYHLSECLYSLPFSSDQAATTDPLSSDMESEVQDILTSPHKNSYPTDPSSDLSSSPRDSKQHLKLAPLLFSRPSSASSQHPQIPPLSSCLPQKRRYLSTLAPTRTLAVNPVINPYDPAAKRIFSRPPTVAPSSVPAPSTSHSSSSMPRSPDPKSSTICLARYRPQAPQESASATQAAEILKLQAALEQSQSDVTRLREQLTNVKDELGNLAEAAYCDFPHDLLVGEVIKTYETTCTPILTVLEETAGAEAIQSNNNEEEEVQNEAEFAAEEKGALEDDPDEEEEEEEEEEMYSTSEEEESDADEEEYCSSDDEPIQPISSSNVKPSSSKQSADSSLTAGELSALVRRRISGSRPRTRDDDMFGKDDIENSCRRPTAFVKRLAETTWDPSDDIEEAGVPGVCNLMNLFNEAKRKKRQREDAESS